jgi:hypothetical protein
MISFDWATIFRDAFGQVPIHPIVIESSKDQRERIAAALRAFGVDAHASDAGVHFGEATTPDDNALIEAILALAARRFQPPPSPQSTV